jgi:hypothetical protein
MPVCVLSCVIALVWAALGVAACSFGDTGAPPRDTALPGPSFEPGVLVKSILPAIVGAAAAASPHEISGMRQVDHIKGPSWLTCVRGNVGGQLRTFAVYIQHARIVDSRMAVMIDRCDEQTYRPL